MLRASRRRRGSQRSAEVNKGETRDVKLFKHRQSEEMIFRPVLYKGRSHATAKEWGGIDEKKIGGTKTLISKTSLIKTDKKQI